MTEAKTKKIKPDIRAITRLVPPAGNLVQGQSELPIDPQLAREAAAIIAASRNHYGGSEGDQHLRKAVAEKIKKYNGIAVDVDAKPLEVEIDPELACREVAGTAGAVVIGSAAPVSHTASRSPLFSAP